MDQVNHILSRIQALLSQLGFQEVVISGEVNYHKGNTYCVPQYVKSLGFLIEYAGSHEDALKHWHEDGEAFPLDMGEEAILRGLRHEIERNCI